MENEENNSKMGLDMEGRRAMAEYQKKWRINNPEKAKAYIKRHKATEEGRKAQAEARLRYEQTEKGKAMRLRVIERRRAKKKAERDALLVNGRPAYQQEKTE